MLDERFPIDKIEARDVTTTSQPQHTLNLKHLVIKYKENPHISHAKLVPIWYEHGISCAARRFMCRCSSRF
jgi:hypothetical protein